MERDQGSKLSPAEAMDHADIEARGLVESYHRGLLPPEEEALFEQHFMTCERCMEQLELARGFRKGLKTAVTEDAARATLARVGLFAWLARRGPAAQWGMALALLALVALPAIWSGRRSAAPPGPPRGLSDPLINTPVFLLAALRGDEEPVVIDRSTAGDLFALAVDVGADPGFESYRATITREGRAVFESSGLRPNALETLMITFPSSFFSPGEHRLRVEGVRPGGAASEIGGYPFRVR
jgi:Putative zinc-finger